MTILEAAALGLLQGLTEFLPISSSGHLVIAQHFLGIDDGGLFFEVLVHCATLAAVLAVYWHDIVELIKKPFQKYTYLLIAGTIPTGIIGLAFKDSFEAMFTSINIVGYTLLITGFILILAEFISRTILNSTKFTYWQSLLIGLGQGLAITPGISRSGTTIAVALLVGLEREEAARFSFLLSIPAILGASIVEAKDIVLAQHISSSLALPSAVGALAALVSGYAAIKLLLGVLKRGKLYYFSIYCWLLGAAVIFLA